MYDFKLLSQKAAVSLLADIKDQHPEIEKTHALYERVIAGDAPTESEWQSNIDNLARARDMALDMALARARARALARARARDLDMALDMALARARARDLDLARARDLVNHLLEIAGDEIPLIIDLDKRILEDIENNGFFLNQDTWHTCETTHCRAGFSELYAEDVGKEMVKHLGHWLTGALIYKKSTGRIPNFYASNEDALADVRAHA